MGVLLKQQGKLTEAHHYYREALEGRRRVLGDELPNTLSTVSDMAAFLNAQARYEESAPLCREAVETGEQVLGADHYRVAEARSLLGEALAGQKQYEDAEHLLLGGYAALDTAVPAGGRSQLLPPAIKRLVTLYEAWGNADKADQWRAKLLEADSDQ